MPDKDARNRPDILFSGLSKTSPMLPAEPVTDRFRRRPRHSRMGVRKPLQQVVGFGANSAVRLAARPTRTMLLFHKVHGTRPSRRASAVVQRFGKRPITGHVRLENHQAPPPRTTPVF